MVSVELFVSGLFFIISFTADFVLELVDEISVKSYRVSNARGIYVFCSC